MFVNSVRLFSIGGFDIKLDPSWGLIAALITWGLFYSYFPSVLPEQTAQIYFVMALTGMLLFFASLLLHELAHCIVARHFGLQIKGITLFLFGGLAELAEEPASARVEFWVALAGPAMSFLLALAFWGLAGLEERAGAPQQMTAVADYLALANLIVALFNLVPAFPLDGGRMLRAVLWQRTGNSLKATEMAATSGAVFAYGLMALGVLALFGGSLVGGLWSLMIGAFVLLAARASYKWHLAARIFPHKTVADLMQPATVTASPDLSLSDFADLMLRNHRAGLVPVTDQGILLGHMDRQVLSGIDREHWGQTRVGDVFAPLSPDGMVAPDLPLDTLMTRIGQTGRRKFLVTRGNHLHGVITLADLTEYLALADMLRHTPADKPTLE